MLRKSWSKRTNINTICSQFYTVFCEVYFLDPFSETQWNDTNSEQRAQYDVHDMLCSMNQIRGRIRSFGSDLNNKQTNLVFWPIFVKHRKKTSESQTSDLDHTRFKSV